MPRPKPTCRHCGNQHFNFVACAQVAEFEAREAEQAAAEAHRNTLVYNGFARNEFTNPPRKNFAPIAPNVFMRKPAA